MVEDQPGPVLIQHLDRDDGCHGGSSVYRSAAQRIAQNRTGHVSAVRIYVLLPLVGQLGDVSVVLSPAAERLGILGGDPLLGEILPPGREQAGIQNGHVHAGPIIGHCAGIGRHINYVDGVLVPSPDAIGKIRCRNRVNRPGIALSVRSGGGNEGQRSNGGKLARLGLYPNRVQLGDLVHQRTVFREFRTIGRSGPRLQNHVDADGAAGGGELTTRI